MTNRNGQVLVDDEENQLVQVTNPGGSTVTFGYADGGVRLWKQTNSGLDIWIGGIFEIKGGKTLCHVYANGQQVCTFEPTSATCAWLENNQFLGPVYAFTKFATTWPLQDGRTPLTTMLIPLLGILCVSVVSRHRLFSHEKHALSLSNGARKVTKTGSIIVRFCASLWPSNSGCLSPALQRRYSRIRVHSCNSRLKAVSVFLIVALFMAVTPTQVEAAIYDPVFYYYHSDHLGSSTILTDTAGDLVQHYEYLAFGSSQHQNNTDAFSVSNRYTGQVLDEDTGLYYYGARYYDPALGRFIQPDPTVPSPGNPQSLNRYSYVRNNPLNRIDPSGLLDDFGGFSFDFSLGNFGGFSDISSFTLQGTAGLGFYAGWSAPVDLPWAAAPGSMFDMMAASAGQPAFDYNGTFSYGQLFGGFLLALSGIIPLVGEGQDIYTMATTSSDVDRKLAVMSLGVSLMTGTLAPNWSSGSRGVRMMEGAASLERTNQQLIQEITTRSERAIGGTGRFAGTDKHAYAKQVLDRYQGIYGDRGLLTETTWLNGQRVPYGRAGAPRIDVLDVNANVAFDYKFTIHAPALTLDQTQRILTHGPPGLNRVLEINP